MGRGADGVQESSLAPNLRSQRSLQLLGSDLCRMSLAGAQSTPGGWSWAWLVQLHQSDQAPSPIVSVLPRPGGEFWEGGHFPPNFSQDIQ